MNTEIVCGDEQTLEAKIMSKVMESLDEDEYLYINKIINYEIVEDNLSSINNLDNLFCFLKKYINFDIRDFFRVIFEYWDFEDFMRIIKYDDFDDIDYCYDKNYLQSLPIGLYEYRQELINEKAQTIKLMLWLMMSKN